MAEKRVQRRLVAILAADVVSYSRLMRADEAGTLARLKAHRKESIDPTFEAHDGRIVKTTGDGFLVEFASVVDAVECAIDIQREMAVRNASVPEEQRFVFRIGLNLGDVIIDGEDIYGDGVNIAARLEGLAEPGGICVSHPVYESVKDKLELGFENMGERLVKNIETPVQMYRVRLDGKSVPTRRPPRARRMWLAGAALLVAGVALFAVLRPTPDTDGIAAPIVAVLPFRAIGGGGDGAVLGEGLTEDLIATLSDQTGLRVISGRPAVAAAEQPQPDPREMGRQLRARYVLDGSVRAAGEQVRITALLVDAVTGYHLWGGRYDRALTDVFGLQDEVAGRIVATLAEKLTDSERQRIDREAASALNLSERLWRGLENLGRLGELVVLLPMRLIRWITGGDAP
jgi:class 3 adenylate cyclase